MSLSRTKYHARRHANNNVATLLKILGIDVRVAQPGRGKPCQLAECPRRKVPCMTFWDRPECEIRDTYAAARRAYLQRMKQAHPDAGGDNSEAVYLNHIWKRIERIFDLRKIRLDDHK